MTNNYNNVLFLKLILLLLHVVECECFTSIQISLSKQFMCSSLVGRDWDFLRQLLELHKDGEGPSRLPHNGSSRERAPETITTIKGPASGDAGGVQSRAHGSM